ncbi:MAG TPA: hypothetical protein VLI06_05975 [Solimonas sp.]|nr:hypothetical protein [Solimonas sp.]
MNKLLFSKVEEAFRETLRVLAPEFRESRAGRRAAGSLTYSWETAAGVCFIQLYAPGTKEWVTIKVAWSQDGRYPKQLDTIDFLEIKNNLLSSHNDALTALDDLPAILLTPADFAVMGGGWQIPEVSPVRAALILDHPLVRELLAVAGVPDWRKELWLHTAWGVLDGYALEFGLKRLDESDATEVLSAVLRGVKEFLRYEAVPYLRNLASRKQTKNGSE